MLFNNSKNKIEVDPFNVRSFTTINVIKNIWKQFIYHHKTQTVILIENIYFNKSLLFMKRNSFL